MIYNQIFVIAASIIVGASRFSKYLILVIIVIFLIVVVVVASMISLIDYYLQCTPILEQVK